MFDIRPAAMPVFLLYKRVLKMLAKAQEEKEKTASK